MKAISDPPFDTGREIGRAGVAIGAVCYRQAAGICQRPGRGDAIFDGEVAGRNRVLIGCKIGDARIVENVGRVQDLGIGLDIAERTPLQDA